MTWAIYCRECTEGEPRMANDTSSSYALIDGFRISELDLLKYEVRRARAASALLYEKLSARRITELLGDEIASMKRTKDEWVRGAAGAWTGSITEIQVTGGSASGFLRWFQGRMAADDHAVMLDAHPDHFAILKEADGRVSILETTGGWKTPSLFYARFTQDARDAADVLEPSLPVRLIGYLESADGTAQGKVLHQFGDTAEGFQARLAIYWPVNADPEMIKGHQWHLACEFVNWTKMYVESLG
jgi:hypothetical protein